LTRGETAGSRLKEILTVGEYSEDLGLLFQVSAMSLAYDPGSGAERPQDVRIIVNIPASFFVSSGRTGGGARSVFSGRAVSLSTRTVALTSPVRVAKGDKVVACIDQLGKLEGEVCSLLASGFVMSITATDEDREKLWRKIEWLEQHKNLDVSDKRNKPRFVPKNPHSKMISSDGRVERCKILDISATGAAISVEIVPEIGCILAIGAVVGRVVRQFKGGFAAQFVESLSDADLAALVNGD
jgi:hypothetical protein